MSAFVPDSTLLLVLNEIYKSDEEVACSALPVSYFQAIHPDMWLASTVYVIGDTSRSPTDNNFVYECIADGTSGSTEPGWATTQDGEFTDGTVTWKAHENVSLANCPLITENKTIAPGDVSGHVLTIAQIMGIVTHRAGTLSHIALIEHSAKKLHHATTANTTIVEHNLVEANRTTIFHELTVDIQVEVV